MKKDIVEKNIVAESAADMAKSIAAASAARSSPGGKVAMAQHRDRGPHHHVQVWAGGALVPEHGAPIPWGQQGRARGAEHQGTHGRPHGRHTAFPTTHSI